MFKDLPTWIKEMRAELNCIDSSSAAAQMSANGGTLIDVREPGEFNEASAAGAFNIPRGVLEMKVTQLVPDPNSTIYVHCATGGRATFAAKQLVELGYLNVVVITCPAATVIESFNR